MAKKKKWWEQATSYKALAEKYPNSFKQHETKYPAKEYLTDDGYDEYNDGYYNDGYDDWSRNLGNKQDFKLTDTKKEYNQNYGTYQQTGHWYGYNYYRIPQLTYKYVQQMANALAGQHNITLVVGNTWEVDLVKKQLTYNPSSLIYGTKSELLATLLHEIGKLRYMTHYTQLNNKYLSMYKSTAAEALMVFEDVRVDYQMLKVYASAAELYESAIPGVQKQIQMYLDFDKRYKKLFESIIMNRYRFGLEARTLEDEESRRIYFLQNFGTSDISLVQQRINDMVNKFLSNGTLFAYCADMLHVMYDIETPNSGFQNIKDKVEKSIPFIEPTKKETTSQATVDILDDNVYPVIEDLLKQLENTKDEIRKMFPEMSASQVDGVANEIDHYMKNNTSNGQQVSTPRANEDGTESSRLSSGPSQNQTPPEWTTGEYKPLKDSVIFEVNSMVRRLTFIKREEMTNKYTSNQKRGKLNTRQLVKHAFGSRRLFRQKIPNIDTVQSFAFSVLMDVSGSMEGDRIVNTTRAVVMFNEVFKKMNISFEFITFDDGATVVKSFESQTDKKIESEIAGLVNYNSGGGTNLDRGLKKISIKNRPEKNKVVIVLTDGGVGDPKQFDSQFFNPWAEKHNIKTICLGLELSSSHERKSMQELNNGTGIVVENASGLPEVFSNILKTLIKQRK